MAHNQDFSHLRRAPTHRLAQMNATVRGLQAKASSASEDDEPEMTDEEAHELARKILKAARKARGESSPADDTDPGDDLDPDDTDADRQATRAGRAILAAGHKTRGEGN